MARHGIAATYADLMRLTGSDDETESLRKVGEHGDLETWLDFEDYPDRDVGFVVRVESRGTYLTFPFAVSLLWEVIDKLEAELREEWDAEFESDSDESGSGQHATSG